MKVRPQELVKIRDLFSSEYRSALSAAASLFRIVLVAERVIGVDSIHRR